MREWCQPWWLCEGATAKKRRAADIIRLEWSAMKESACSGMKWSGKQTNEWNGMKRYCGCISPTERRKRPCEDEERTAQKNKAVLFLGLPYFFVLWSACGTEGPSRSSGWRKVMLNHLMPQNSVARLEQPNGTKGTTGGRPLDGSDCFYRIYVVCLSFLLKRSWHIQRHRNRLFEYLITYYMAFW